MGFEFFDICYIIIHSKFPYGRFRIIIISMETETKEINNVFFKDIHVVVRSFLSVRNVTSGRLIPSRLSFFQNTTGKWHRRISQKPRWGIPSS